MGLFTRVVGDERVVKCWRRVKSNIFFDKTLWFKVTTPKNKKQEDEQPRASEFHNKEP